MSAGGTMPHGSAGAVDYEESELFASDPRIAPGLPRPIGWRVRSPDGTQGYDKFGPNDVDWVPVGVGAAGAVTQFNGAVGPITTSVDPGLTQTIVGGNTKFGQVMVAEWTIGTGTRRFFAVDFVNGIDATGRGFSDVSMAAAGANACKTVAFLASIFPKLGNGRSAEIAFANGGVNTSQAYAADLLGLVLSGCSGYAPNMPIVRATGTNANAGATAFAGDSADVTYAGMVTCAGCNAAGYNTIGAPTTSVIQLQKVGGAAAALPAEPVAPLMWRVRSLTTNAQNAGQCRTVGKVSTTGGSVDTISLATAFTTAPTPGNGDVYVLEQAGVTFTGGNLAQCQPLGGTPNGNVRPMQLVGLLFTSSVTQIGSGATWIGCGVTGFLTLVSGAIYGGEYRCVHPLGTQTIGGGMHITTTLVSNNGSIVNAQVTCFETTGQFNNPTLFRWSQASVAGQGFSVLGYNSGDPTSVDCIGGEPTELLPARVLASVATPGAGIVLTNCKVFLGNIDFTNMGARPGIQLSSSIAYQTAAGGGTKLTGSTGNTNFGLFLSATGEGSAYYGSALATNTLTGTSGDVRAVDPAGADVVLTWAQVNATGFADGRGNRIVVNNGPLAIVAVGTAALTTDAVNPTTNYSANPGSTLAPGAGVGPQRFPTSLRLITRLRVVWNTGAIPFVTPIVVTLFKNNVATAMTLSVPQNTASGTKFSDTAHAILYLDSDDFDVVLTNAGGVNGNALLTWTLEGPC